MNLIPCRLQSEADHIRITPIAADRSQSMQVPKATFPFVTTSEPIEVDLGLRPEAIHINADESPAMAPTANPTVSTQIRRLEFHGPEAWATLSLGPQLITARPPATQPLQLHQHINATLDLTRAVWFDQSGNALPPS